MISKVSDVGLPHSAKLAKSKSNLSSQLGPKTKSIVTPLCIDFVLTLMSECGSIVK